MTELPAAPVIRLEGVVKSFGPGRTSITADISIARGEFFSLLGPSGCGKTTLLRMIAGFEVPDRGRVSIDGIDMAGVPPYARPVNMMFQSYALFPHMSVAENVAFGLKQDGRPKREIGERVEAALSLLKMNDLAKRMPDRLSGGEKQRVALARALVKEPKVLLLDEPLAALDKKLREETQFELVALQERLGITFVMVTHDQEEAMAMSSRIGVMIDGTVDQVGAPREIYEFPSSRAIAAFVGDANLFEGKVTEIGGAHPEIHCADLADDIKVIGGAALQPGRDVTVMVRPEKISIAKERHEDGRNWAKGIVKEIAYRGDFSIYRVLLPSGKIVQLSLANLSRVADRRIEWDDEVWLSWMPSACLVLDR